MDESLVELAEQAAHELTDPPDERVCVEVGPLLKFLRRTAVELESLRRELDTLKNDPAA